MPGRRRQYSAGAGERRGTGDSYLSGPTMDGDPIMSDYRNPNYDYRNPEDPFPNDANLDPNVRAPSSAWGWIAAAVFLVVILAVAFGYGHKLGQLGTNTASNDVAPPAATRMAPPAAVPLPSTAAAPRIPTPPLTAAPNSPAQPSPTH